MYNNNVCNSYNITIILTIMFAVLVRLHGRLVDLLARDALGLSAL